MPNEIDLERIRNGVVYASDYECLGWWLVPIHAIKDGTCTCGDASCTSPGKHPRIVHGLKNASADREQFDSWTRRWLDLNLGVHTGKSGLVVLDFDAPDALENLIETIEPLDRETVKQAVLAAPAVQTANGFHSYFKAPDGVVLRPRVALARSVDVRCGESYAIVPPSKHIDGLDYKWIDRRSVFETPAAPLPSALVALINGNPGPRNDTFEQLPKGTRNVVLASIAGSLRKHGLSAMGIYDNLTLLNDGGLFIDPLPDVELRTISASIGNYTIEGPSLKLEPRSFREIVTNPSPPPSYIVNRLFLKNQIGLLVGLPYSGKSTVGLDLAVSLAAGIPALDNPSFAVPGKHRVLYVYGEQDGSLWEARLRAIAAFRGIPEDEDLGVILLAGYGLRINQADHMAELIRLSDVLQIDVLFLDPLAVLAGVDDENDASGVARDVRMPLQDYTRTGRSVIGIHHSAKNRAYEEPVNAAALVRGSGDYIAMTGSIVGLWRKPKSGMTKVLVQGRLASPPPFRLIESFATTDEGDESGATSGANSPLRFDGDWSEEQQSHRLAKIEIFLKSRIGTLVSRREIEEATGIRRATLVRDLQILRFGHKVRAIGEGKNIRYEWIIEPSDEVA